MQASSTQRTASPEDIPALVLVVDDDPGNLVALRAVLESLGETVVEASSGEAALKYLLDHDVAVILLDAHLPGMTGFEVAEALRARPRTRDIPILFVTGSVYDGATAGYAQGAFDYIVKPYDPDAVRAKVAALVKLYRQQRRTELQRDALAESERAARAESASERAAVHQLLSQAPALIARLRGPNHLFEFANPRYMESIDNRDPVGKTMREVFPDPEERRFQEILDRVYSTGQSHTANAAPVRLSRRKGEPEEAYFNFVYQPTRDADGEVNGILVLAIEVTEQVRAAKELARIADFQQELLGIVGHDLRNPLNAILLATQMLQRTAEPPLQPPLMRIARSAVRMRNLINDLVDYTRARLGAAPVQREPCEIADLCREVIDELSAVNPERRIRLDAEDAGEGLWQRSRIQQMVSNLIANAIQYSLKESEIVVEVTGDPAEVRIAVHNMGRPIPPEALASIFEPFRRVGDSQVHGVVHLGLGLYIVQQVARAHGGTVDVRSDEGQGTHFFVTLPRNSPAGAGHG